MREINLLQIHRKITEKETDFIKNAKIGALLLLIFYCLVVGGIFSLWLILKRQNELVSKKVAFQEERINELREVESLHTFFKQRLAAVTPLITKKTIDYSQTLARLESLVPIGVDLTEIDLKEGGQLSLTGTAANAVVFADFLERLIVSGSEEFAKNVKLSSTSRQEDGSYIFSLKINVKS